MQYSNRPIKLFTSGCFILMLGWGIAPLSAAGPQNEVPGRVVVKLTPPGAAQMRKGTFLIPISREARGRLKPTLTPLFSHTQGPLSLFGVLTWDVTGAAGGFLSLAENAHWIEAMTQDPQVLSAESDGWVTLSALPDDPFFNNQIQLRNPGGLSLHGSDVWPFISPDDEVVVAVLDSGVDWPHPDLGGSDPVLNQPKGIIWLNTAEAQGVPGVDDDANGKVDDFVGWDFVDVPSIPDEFNAPDAAPEEDGTTPDNNPMDYSGHGTYCAGLVTAITNNSVGLAGHPAGVKIMPVRVAYSANGVWGSGVAYFSWFSQALVYAADAGADVASLSFHTDFYPPELEAAVDHAIYTRGMSIVNAAGNFGSSSFEAGQAYLASQPEVIAVAGVHPDGRKWSGSNYGDWVNIAAFARGMPSTYQVRNETSYSYLTLGTGTSWSCPTVAGGVALIRLAAPELGPLEVMDALVTTGQDLTPYEPIYADRLGGGLADISAAIEKVGGGWKRALTAHGLTPMENGLLAVTGDGGITVLDIATAEERFSWEGQVVEDVRPCVLHHGEDQMLAFASGSPGDYAVNLVNDLGVSLDGWPKSLAEQPKEIAVIDWGIGGADALVLLSGTSLTVWGMDGSELITENSFPAEHLVIGDFNQFLEGTEIAGYKDGQQLLLSPQGLVTHHIPGFILGDSEPVGILLADNQALVFASTDSTFHALDAGVKEREGFPVVLGSHSIQHISIIGDEDGGIYALATDAGGMAYRIDTHGNVMSWDAMSGIAGELLAVDLDQDFHPDILVTIENGTLAGRSQTFDRTLGFPRNFPQALAGTPSVQDHPNGKRYIAAMDDSGRVWSIPLPQDEATPLVWSTERGSNQRTGFITYAAATPVLTAWLEWNWTDSQSGDLCWRGTWDASLESFRIDTPGESVVVDRTARCAGLSQALPGEIVILRARFRGQETYVELARLELPPVILAVLDASPNPFAAEARLGFAPAQSGAELEMFDVRGRLVFRAPVPLGSRSYVWEGNDSQGNTVPPGIYFARITQKGGTRTIKLVKTP